MEGLKVCTCTKCSQLGGANPNYHTPAPAEILAIMYRATCVYFSSIIFDLNINGGGGGGGGGGGLICSVDGEIGDSFQLHGTL